MKISPRLAVPAASLGLLMSLSFAPVAHAGLLAASATNCEPEVMENPFVPWYDIANYVRVPGGSFEPGVPAWTVSRAAVAAGNERFHVADADDSHSLAIAAGGYAASPTMCVGVGHPTLRLFARNTGSPLATLAVSVHFWGPLGQPASANIGVVAGGGSWQPTAVMVMIANVLPLLPDEMTPVFFRFTAIGSGAAWQIDDVYVDPYRKG